MISPATPPFSKMKKLTAQDCINAFCLTCKDHDLFAIGNCAKDDCPLHPLRPNRSLKGKSLDDYDLDELQQSVLDALDFTGLKEKSHV